MALAATGGAVFLALFVRLNGGDFEPSDYSAAQFGLRLMVYFLLCLSPQFIPAIPRDVINGQPLHYRRTPGGEFVLYSVGWNGRDDGGTLGWTHSPGLPRIAQTGDWVWLFPQNN